MDPVVFSPILESYFLTQHSDLPTSLDFLSCDSKNRETKSRRLIPANRK